MKKLMSFFLAIIFMVSFVISFSADSKSSNTTLKCNHSAYLNAYLYAAGSSSSASSNCSGHMTSCHVYVAGLNNSAQDPANWNPRESMGATYASVSLSESIIYASSSHGAWCDSGNASSYLTINL